MITSFNKRLIFALLWSLASVLGFIMYYSLSNATLGYFLGFHFIKDALTWGLTLGLYSDYPELMILFLILGIVFVGLWILSLFRINKNFLFEYLIVVDNAISLFVYSIFAIIQRGDFALEKLLVGIVIENIIVITFFIYFINSKRKTSDSSPPLD